MKQETTLLSAVENFVQLLNDRSKSELIEKNERYEKIDYKKSTLCYQYEFKEGTKYIKIIMQLKCINGESKIFCNNSVHSFIDKSNGNILKAATWNTPVKNTPRGNIFDENPLQGTNTYGANYLKR